MGYYPAIKRTKHSFVATWVVMEIIILNEVSQAWEGKHDIIHGIERARLSEAESRWWLSQAGEGEILVNGYKVTPRKEEDYGVLFHRRMIIINSITLYK